MTPNQDTYLSFMMDQEQGFREDGKMYCSQAQEDIAGWGG